MANIALFFGSFNPIHLGHLGLAKETLKLTDSDEVWFVLSPVSPFKVGQEMIDVKHRLKMIELAINKNKRLKACDIEVEENLSGYTVDTLKLLSEKYPEHTFSILMGEDNIKGIDNWKDAEFIKDNYTIFVYPRKNNEFKNRSSSKNIIFFDADYINISSTQIREIIVNGKDVIYYLPIGVYDYIKTNNLLLLAITMYLINY